eukprot:gene2043-2514_t
MNIKSLRKGRHFPSLDHEEVYNRITENSNHMDELQKNLEKQQQSFFVMANHSKIISESMKKYSNDSVAYNSRIPLTDCLQRASEWQSSINEIFNHLGNLLYDRTTQPMRETIRIQLEVVKEGKKKLKSMKPESSSGSGGGSGGSSFRVDVKRDQENYDRVVKDTLNLYQDSELALENSAVQTVLAAYESYYDFFQKGVFQMSKIKTEIDNYKKIILETNKVAAKLRNYVPRKTFGVKLEEIFAREAHRPMPLFLEEMFKFLEKRAPSAEGIFRISAGKSAQEGLQQRIESSGAHFDLNNIDDPHVVSSVLKLFFRSLPEPLIYYSNYQKYLQVASRPVEQHIPELKRLISSLPVCNQLVVKHVLAICFIVNQHKDITKMDLTNLAVVIGPNLMESIPNLKAEDIQKAETFAEVNALFSILVENYQHIFPTMSQSDLGRSRAQTEPILFNPNAAGNTTPKPLPQLPAHPLPQIPPSPRQIQQPQQQQPSPNLQNTQPPPPPPICSPESQNNSSSLSNSTTSSNGENSPTNSDLSKLLGSPIRSESPPTTGRKKSSFSNDSDYLKPIDMQIYYTNIISNLGKLKSILDSTKTPEEGIPLIKSFKKISDSYIIPIQQTINFRFTKDKPVLGPDDDKMTKLKKTLIYTYEKHMESIKEANNIFESTNIDEPTPTAKQIEIYFKQLDEFLSNEIKELNNSSNVDSNENNNDNSNFSLSASTASIQ